VKFVKRTVVSSDVSSQSNTAGRRIVTAGTQQSVSGGVVHRPGGGIRRVISSTSSSKSADGHDLPTVQLCDLPTNLTLSDINQMVANAGVGQPLSVDYVPGSQECIITFRVPEVAAKFYQKINRRMVNMSFIRAKMIL
ncbi:hypothetical protein OTU49_010647, partial [Cherax quadricarinatus]